MKKRLVLILVFCALALLACTVPAKQKTAQLTPPEGSTSSPPTIPHEVGETDNQEVCLGCHAEPDSGAPPTPHPQFINCRQCHVPQLDVPPFSTSY